MPYYFFFSYARANNDSYLLKFFDNLSDEIRDILGFGKDKEVGFLDQKDIELGAAWDPEIVEALQTCPVLISLYSPAYFNSRYCGKEFEFFKQRRALYQQQASAAGDASAKLPPVIKPVIWIPLRDGQKPPAAVSEAQYTMDDPAAPYNVEGLKTMRKQINNFEGSYESFIKRLANQTLDALEKFSLPKGRALKEWLDLDPPTEKALPPLNPTPLLAAIDSTFYPIEPGGEQAAIQDLPLPPGDQTEGPKFVRFVVVAAKPGEFTSGREPIFYLKTGGIDWKPYHPEASYPIVTVAQAVAGQLGIVSSPLAFSNNLPQNVRDAEKSKSIVVIFVDGWTAELEPYKTFLQQLDAYSYLNCSIFVPLNEKDTATAVRRDQLRELVRTKVFPRWSRLSPAGDKPSNFVDSIYFSDSVYTVEQFRTQLQITLTQLQSLIGQDAIEHATKDDVPLTIQSNISKPTLSHKGDLP